MFVNCQDSTVLHGALMSATNAMQSSLDQDPNYTKTFQLKDKKGVADLVSATVVRLTRDRRKVNSALEYLKMQQHVHRRLHSAVFFVALRSNGITCEDANKYYESLSPNFPSMDWRFYLKLNYQCNWSEYFIECAVQLEPDILAAVIKGMLPVFKEEDMKCYLWHISLQSIIWKFFQLDDPSIFQPPENSVFNFPFIDRQTAEQKSQEEQKTIFNENPSRSKLLFEYVTILNQVLQSPYNSFSFVKVALHFFKTTFKLFKKLSACNPENIKELFRMGILLEACFKEDALVQSILSANTTPRNSFVDHTYAITSWEIGTTYLLFLLLNYAEDAETTLRKDETGCFSSLLSAMPQIDHDMLFELCTVYKLPTDRLPTENRDPNLELLKAIIRYDYAFASRAAEIILTHKEIRNQQEIIQLLTENISKLRPFEIYPVIADTVVETECLEIKNIFKNLFFKVLGSASYSIYNDALKYILDHYGITEHFKLSVADTLLIKFARKTMPLDEAEKLLLPLFIQEPLVVLKTLIEQALIRGAEGIAIVPVLKHIPSVCLHKDNSYLVKELSSYFLKEKLKPHEEKNLPNLVESIMKVQVQVEILSFDTFLEECILPNFSKNLRIDLMLECLNVSLRILTNEGTLKITNGSFFALIKCLTASIQDCIKSGNGKRKELLLISLSLLGENKLLCGKNFEASFHFTNHLLTLDPIVTVYLKHFYDLQTYNDGVNLWNGISEVSWIYCCNAENPEQEFKEMLFSLKTVPNYNLLLNTLFPLLSHCTKKEWTKSADFLKVYFEYLSPDELCSSIPSLLPKTDPQLYAVARTLMDCYTSVLKNSNCDKQYMTSCLTNTIIDIVVQKTEPQLLLNIFLDACHIAASCEMNTLHLLSSFLISIKKCIDVASDDKLLKNSYLKLALTGVKCLPDSEAKASLLQKF